MSSVEASVARLFGTSSGWGLYETQSSARERWLQPRHALSWYLPLAGRLEWREQARAAELVFLNGTRTRARVDDSLTVGRIIAQLGGRLGLSASAVGEYGLKFGGQLSAGLDDKDVLTSGWLDPRLTLQDHGVTAATKLELRWLKRFFVADHSISLADEVDMHYSFLECKNSFLTDALDTTGSSVDAIAQCVACLLHVDHGRYDRKKHTQQWYSGKKYVPELWTDSVSFSVAAMAWKALAEDLAPKKAFIDMCRKFPGFASTFFDAVVSDTKSDVQVAVSKDKVVLYHPWTSRGGGSKSQRRLSRMALALSPRGGGGGGGGGSEESSSESLASPQASGKATLSKSSAALLRRTSSATMNNETDDAASAASAAVASESPASPNMSNSSDGKSPRKLLTRTFTLRRDRKPPNSTGGASPEPSDRSAVKSGRFKSFGGFRDLNLLKRSATKQDVHQQEPQSGGLTSSSPQLPTASLSSSSSAGAAGDDDDQDVTATQTMVMDEATLASLAVEGDDFSSGAREGRKEIRSIALEDIQRWSIRGRQVALELDSKSTWNGVGGAETLSLVFVSVEAARDFSELLRGYCWFRLEDQSPAALARGVTERSSVDSSSGISRMGVFALRSPAIQLVGEMHSRFVSIWNRSTFPKVTESFRDVKMLQETAAMVLAAPTSSGASLVPRMNQSIANLLSLIPSECSMVCEALESLQLALGCAFPVSELDDEQSPSAVLDCVRGRIFELVVALAALAEGLRFGKLVADVDRFVDHLLTVLEEAVKRPGSLEAHLKLSQRVVVLAPELLERISAARKTAGDSVVSEAVRSCAVFCRDALSNALDVCTPINETISGAEDCKFDVLIKSLWDIESSLRALKDPLVTSKACIDVINACGPLVRSPQADVSVDLLMPDVLKALGNVALCTESAQFARRAGLVSSSSTSSAASPAVASRNRCLLLMVADLVPILVEFLSDSQLRQCYSKNAPSLVMATHCVRLRAMLQQLFSFVVAGSLWEKSRPTVAHVQAAVARLISIEPQPASESNKEWEESWKVQMVDLSQQLKSFKNSVRAVAHPNQVSLTVIEGWTASLVDVVDKVRRLILPFFVVDAPTAFSAASTNIVRAVQMLGGQFVKLVDCVGKSDWNSDALSDLANRQLKIARDVDACLTALNSNNPALAGMRQGAGWSGGGGDAGSGWMRRGEISTQGAALKLKLTNKKKTSENSAGGGGNVSASPSSFASSPSANKFLTASRKKVDTSSLTSAASAVAPSVAPSPSVIIASSASSSADTSPVASVTMSSSSAAGGSSSRLPKARRISGEDWKDEEQ